MKLKNKVAAIVILTAAGVSLTGYAAYADSTVRIYDGSAQAAAANFTRSNHRIAVSDLRSDGYGAQSDYYFASTSGSIYNGYGYGSITYGYPSAPTGTTLHYRICVTNGSAEVGCSGYITDTF